jgi:hypothetical protein
MICPKCAAGADLAAAPGPFAEAAHNLATDLHGECRGGTWCACQHALPSVAQLAERHAVRTGGGLSRVLSVSTGHG